MKKSISIVIPAFNEEEVVDELSARLTAIMAKLERYDFEVIIVENGSWDATYEKLKKINAADGRFKILQMSRNFGCDGAVTAGLRYAKGDAAVIMCADLQDPPEMIPPFVEKWEQGYDIVYGIVQKRVGTGIARRFFSRLFYKVFNALTENAIPDNVSDFRIMDRRVYQAVNGMDERGRLLRGMIAWTGFRQAGIPFERPPRFAGESKANFFTVFRLALNGIFSFTYLPLKLATLLGFVVSAVSFVMIFVELLLVFIYGREVPGFTTLIIVILFLFGMLFLILGIIGEYIARIYDEAKKRPIYIVRDEVGLK